MGMNFGLEGQVAVVTGASSGIGRAIAEGLASEGVAVACLARASDRLEEVVAMLNAAGGTARAYAADVRDEAGVDAAIRAVETDLGPVSLAVNSAGTANTNPAIEMSTTQWQDIMDVNLTGAFLSCRAEAQAMRRTGGGSIVNIASMSGTIANRGLHQAHYNTSKAGVIHLGRSLAWEFASYGIRVNTVSPGYTITPLTNRPEQGDLMAGFAGDTPMQRNAEAEEMYGPVAFLLSSAASFVTGADLVVDGGFTIW